LANDKLRLACGQNARKTAQSFSKEKIAMQWNKLFLGLCKSKHEHKPEHKHR